MVVAMRTELCDQPKLFQGRRGALLGTGFSFVNTLPLNYLASTMATKTRISSVHRHQYRSETGLAQPKLLYICKWLPTKVEIHSESVSWKNSS